MDFTYSETQEAVLQAATEVLDSAAPEAAWKALGQAGLLSLALPESLGGDGLGAIETGIVLTELGRRALVTPAFPALSLSLALTRLNRADLLTADTFLTFALAQPRLKPSLTSAWAALSSTASVPGSASALGSAQAATPAHGTASAPSAMAASVEGATSAAGSAGRKVAVPFLAEASRVLLVGRRETAVAAVSDVEPGFSSSGLAESNATLTAGEAVGGDVFPYLLSGAIAMVDGLLAGALELTTAHLRTREQFGKPLATFQIAAGHIADVYIAWRTTHLLALSLAWGLDTGKDVSADVEAAEHWLETEALKALRTCHHLHGGIGLDVTYPLHRYYSLVKDLTRYVHRSH